VNECAEFIEFISAYADIELSDADKKRVEEHLATCVNCSALLELCREISTAANESSSPAPEVLFRNVMDIVQNESMPRAAGNVKRFGRYRVMLTRYVPIAACLAVVLLALPFVVNRSGQNADSMPAPMQINMALMELEDSDYSSRAVQGAVQDGGIDNESALPDMPEAPPPSPHESDAITPPQGSPPAGEVFGNPGDPSSDSGRQQSAPPQLGGFEPDPPQDLEFFRPGEPPSVVPYYAFIEITGELPEYLSSYESMIGAGSEDTREYILIPRDEADELIELLRDRAGVVITPYSADGEYALVIYDPE
jgi:hypothetical protein